MAEKKDRPVIPESVKRKLWMKAGGRCEFPGCNKYLFQDGVTRQPRNLAHIAHIVSWTPTGPRGNQDSEKLAKEISNLMLVCSEHNNLIDDKQYVDEYPIELLQRFKREHEERIRRVTEMGQEYGVRIIKMFSTIHGQVPSITDNDVAEAIRPYYPLETDIVIDLTQIEDVEAAKRRIKRVMDLHVLSDDQEEAYAVFAMAKIPYSCYLGYVLGDKVKSEAYQSFRETHNWKWREEGGCFTTIIPEISDAVEQVVLTVEVSGNIDKSLIPDFPVYSIKAEEPSVYFLQCRKQVIEFQIKFREIMDKIREQHGEKVMVHLIVAAPNPICFEIGKTIMKNLDPSIILYDKVQNDDAYHKIMTLHERIREEDED